MTCCKRLLLISLTLAGSAGAAEIDFARDIRPILSDNCYHCHGPDDAARQADLRLDTKEGLLGAVKPGNPARSELLRRVTTGDGDERMPPLDSNRSLSELQIKRLHDWIAAGAKWEGHWSFQPVIQPHVPAGRSAIDYFIERRLEQAGVEPAAAAQPERLLRRVTFDLTGLPPTIDELDLFLADPSSAAYENAVDRLLHSPRYGERMAWDWLDAARYADSNGFQGDRDRTMWPWRDWVVRAFNDNMPYDEFTVWQLAGDLLPDASPPQQLATGFSRNHMINGEGGRIPEENRVEYVFDQMETMGTVWLGLTLQCCRCHDHKFDPLSRREYYQLFAFFNQTPVSGAGRDPQTPPTLAVPTARQRAETERLSQQVAAFRKRVQQAEQSLLRSAAGSLGTQAGAPLREILGKPLQDRTEEQLSQLEAFGQQHAAAYAELLSDYRQVRQQQDEHQQSIPRVMVMQDLAEPRETFMLTMGLYNQPGAPVVADTPAVLPALADSVPANRLALANWIVDPANPLTARVTVNRYWQLFFGTALVKTAEDFGAQGARPSHPQLLDWLAAEFVRSNWDVKRLHKLIVMSAAYRRSAKATAESIAADPENRLLARGPRHRLPSWMIRDQALAASGLLVETVGGPPVNPYQPPGVWAEATFGRKEYRQGTGPDLYRRSLYTFWRRIVGPTMFFDAAKRQTCSVRLGRTNTPLHALTTMNDVTYVEAARVMAERVMKADPSDAARVERAFRLVTSRRPSLAETEILVSRLEHLRQQYTAIPEQAGRLLAAGESARDPQLNVIELAAFTGLCSLLLNLDETLSK